MSKKVEYELGGLTFLYTEGKQPAGAVRVERTREPVTAPTTPENKLAAQPQNKLGSAEIAAPAAANETASPIKRTRKRTRRKG